MVRVQVNRAAVHDRSISEAAQMRAQLGEFRVGVFLLPDSQATRRKFCMGFYRWLGCAPTPPGSPTRCHPPPRRLAWKLSHPETSRITESRVTQA